jgi:hypothetical protein
MEKGESSESVSIVYLVARTFDSGYEAERVRTIFRRYLELGSLNLLMADLRERGIVTKVRSLKTGCTVGGIPFTRGPLAHFLRNRSSRSQPNRALARRDRLLGCGDAGQVAAVRGRIVVARTGLTGEEQAIVDRRREDRPAVGLQCV